MIFAERGLPFHMDAWQFRDQPTMTLTTGEGDIEVLALATDIGDYDAVQARCSEVEAIEVRFRLLDLPALIVAKRAANRPTDLAHLPELEALPALRTRKQS